MQKQPLPIDEWCFQIVGNVLAAGIWQFPENCVRWERILLSDLPNGHLTAADLAEFGIAF